MLFKIIEQLEKDITPDYGNTSTGTRQSLSIPKRCYAPLSTEEGQIYYEEFSPEGGICEIDNASINNIASRIPPVLQLNTMPETIDITQFRNPQGPTNSNGDYVSLYRFSDLTNRISRFNLYYYPSGNKIDNIYENIVQGCSIKQDATFTYNAFFKSKQELANSRLSNLAGTPNNWYPAYATPTDWFEQITNKDKLLTSEIDFSNPSEAFSSQFTIIGNQSDEPLQWNRINKYGNLNVTQTNAGSIFNRIRFKFLQVQIERPWLNFDLFNMGGWYLGGQNAGYVSNGEIDSNDGVFPLYPTSFILATDLEIVGNLNAADSAIVLNDIKDNGSINLGPFNINSLTNDPANNADILQNSGYFILGWISQLVNLSPKTSS